MDFFAKLRASAIPALAAFFATLFFSGCGAEEGGREARPPAPVEVAPVEVGRIELRRQLSGSLLPSADFYAAPRISGQVKELRVGVADSVVRGQVIAVLDDAGLVQSLRQAEANLLVAKANLTAAEARMEIAVKDSERAGKLRERGISSDAQLEAAQAERLSAEAGLAVADAQIARAEAEVESARIELSETRVRADWTGGAGERIIAERLVDEGDAVSANQPIFRVVDLDPLLGVVQVTERDYANIIPGGVLKVMTDAFPGEVFSGTVTRVAPVFSVESRQAQVEFEIGNTDHRLKPGMFVRVSIVLGVNEEAVIVPDLAIVRRDDTDGVFVLGEGRETAHWRPVRTGIREGDRVEIVEGDVSGEVITLGQQLVNDGSRVRVTQLEGETQPE